MATKSKKKTKPKKKAPLKKQTINPKSKTCETNSLIQECKTALESNTKTLEKLNKLIQFRDTIVKSQNQQQTALTTVEQVRAKLIELQKKIGREAPLKLLKKFGVNKIPDLKENNYSEIIELADKKLSEVIF